MNILLIGNKETSGTPEQYYGDYAAFFDKALSYSTKGGGIKFTLIDDLIIAVGDDTFSIYDSRHACDIADYDLILIRGKGFRNMFDTVKTISSYGTHKNVPVINNYTGFRDSSKLMQAVQFFELGLPVACTVLVTPAVLTGKAPLPFGFPCIMKAAYGAHGNDNYLVNSMLEASEIAAKSAGKRFVLQRFVPNDNDYRVLIIGGEVLVIGRSAANGSHLNNTSQGGSAVLANGEVPDEVITQSRKIMEHLDMTIAGVDLLADKNTGKFYFLEVNSQPQLMSGAFIDEKAQALGKFFNSL